MTIKKKPTTLLLVTRGAKNQRNLEVLLGFKKRGFGVGKWNGFGGKVEPGETILEACKRECIEECLIEPLDVRQLGVIHFKFESDPTVLEVHIFHAPKFSGEPGETEEMRPQWFPAPSVPFDQMWPDDRFWWPLFMKGV
eukprot:984578_1